MRRSLFTHVGCLATLFIFFSPADGFCKDPTPAPMTSTTIPSSTIQGREPLEPVTKEAPARSSPTLPAPVMPSKATPQKAASYLHPGILVYINGKWEGSDHLLNLSRNIGVDISIVKPENENINITEEQIKKEVGAIFEGANIKPQIMTTQGKPPLPVFQIEIFIYPIERGYVACIEGRLFESVVLDRFKLDPNMAFQAITWEKQQLIISPNSQFADHVIKTTKEIAETFADRFEAYEKIKHYSGFQ